MNQKNDDGQAVVQTGKPVYLQIREDLLRELRENHAPRLPSEREICQKYNVCRPTVHKALSYFLEKNMIIRRPGKGTFFRENILQHETAISGVKVVIRHDWQDWEGDSYFGQAIQGVFGVLSHLPFNVGIEKFNDNLLYQLLNETRTASIWLSPEAEEIKAIRQLADADCNVAVINREINHPGVLWVSSDHQSEGKQAAEYLIAQNQSRITYICSEAEKNIFSARDTGIRHALTDSAVKIDYRAEMFAADNWTKNLEKTLQKITAVPHSHQAIVFNNGALLPLIAAILERQHLCIPNDISLIAFGDSADAEKLGVTVIRQPVEKLGRIAAEIIAGKREDQCGMRLPCLLFERNSVKKLT